MALIDHFAGLLQGPDIAGTATQGAWFDGDDLTVGILNGTSGSDSAFVIDLGASHTVHLFRIRWHYGSGGTGNANSFAIDTGSSATGPWTEVLTDTDPVGTAGVTWPQDFELTYELDTPETARWWRFRGVLAIGNNDIFTVEGIEDTGIDPDEPPIEPEYVEPEPAKAVLEIYVHDEDASRWGTATWATGAATGTEGVWSAAGWQDITPIGVRVHIQSGSRAPERGILADQDPASWRVEMYDPERVLDPGNPDSPYYPQLVPGVPIRLSHDANVLRTGVAEVISFNHRSPEYQGEWLCTDGIALMGRAEVPEDSDLADFLFLRAADAVIAAGIEVGGLPITGSYSDPTGPALSPRIEGPASVWDHINSAAREVLHVAFIKPGGDLGFRSWGAPLERGREFTDPNLEDLGATIAEDGVYSVVRVANADDTLTITRQADPLPRYGRRVYERTDTTIDPEGFADQVLAERSWPGVQYVPGTVHCFTAADVNGFGTIEVMERIQLTVAGVVSVSGRVLGSELWAEHNRYPDQGATWMFLFHVATEGSTAIGTTTLVADGSGDTLLDDDSETDYLEAD